MVDHRVAIRIEDILSTRPMFSTDRARPVQKKPNAATRKPSVHFSRRWMSHRDWLSRLSRKEETPMRNALLWIVGLLQLTIAAMMLFAPESFYDIVPGVSESGPFNPHFVRDVGAAFLVAGAGLLWFARDAQAGPAALAGAAFLALHALMHVWDGLAGRERPAHLLHDLPLLIGIAALALWLAWPRRDPNSVAGGHDDAEMAAAAKARRLRT
jgi:hypothetical protein